MAPLLKRLELIKTSITLGDMEIIEFQLPKLIALAKDESAKAIVQDLQRDAITEALKKIDAYLNQKQGLVVYDDIELQAIRLELKQLEQRIEELHLKRDEMSHLIEKFQYEYQLELGSIINDILALRKEIQAFRIQQQKAEFERKQQAFKEAREKLDELKTKRQELEDELEQLDPFEDADNYEALEEELEALQESIKDQQSTVKETRNKAKLAKEEFEESPEAKAFEEAETEYEEFKKAHDEVLEEERIELKKEEEKELKLLFRKAAKLCHPDTVADDLKEQATEMMKQLNEARRLQDLSLVREIYEKLKNGIAFVVASDKLTDKSQMQAKLDELLTVRHEIESEISIIETSDSWQEMPDIEEWEDYFSGIKVQLEAELERLQSEMAQLLSPQPEKPVKQPESQTVKQTHNSPDTQADDDFWSSPF